MIEYAKELLRLTNTQVIEKQNVTRIRDLICYLSENKSKGKLSDIEISLIDSILYKASMKMRTFGYNTLNKFNNEHINAGSEKAIICDDSLLNFYRAESNPKWYLDKRQKEVVEFYNALPTKRLFLSAPTSFGKTFLLKEIILSNRERYKTIVIVLPTVALLQEVSNDLKEFCHESGLTYKIVNSIYFLQEDSECRVMVLTPERVLQVFALESNFQPDFFFFDEIYKIDEDISDTGIDGEATESDVADGKKNADEANMPSKQRHSRGVAFRVALYLLSKSAADFYIAGPFIDLDSLGDGFERFIRKFDIQKYQIKFEPTMKNKIEFTGKTYHLHPAVGKEIKKQTNCVKVNEKIEYLKTSLPINEENQTIFYVLNPADTYKHALSYAETESETIKKERFLFFIEHLKKTYSLSALGNDSVNQWSFFKALQKGVGIHNGKLPRYIQKEVMNLFNNKKIDTLFCTSTIIEGVNTNAKNIVLVHNPSGKNDSGKRFSLLNINGRAGRYLKHFIGNIVYLNANQKKIEQSQNIVLDYKSYGTTVISDLDLENLEYEDLTNCNGNKKEKLDKKFDFNLLPDEVFLKNRLVERTTQETFLKTLLKDEWFDCFKGLLGNNINLLDVFIKKSMLKSLTALWKELGQISEYESKQYNRVSTGYAMGDYGKILKDSYDFENKKGHVDIDKLYSNTFSEIKKIVEYEVPKIMSLFQTLFNRALELKGISRHIDLLPIIRYYELGVKSEIGAKMIEWGIPVMTVKIVEKVFNFWNQRLDEQMEIWERDIGEITSSREFDRYELALLTAFNRDRTK